MQILVQNRGVGFHYQIQERFEAGLVLRGSEVKSLRNHRGNLAEAYIAVRERELFLHNAHIAEYSPAHQFGHAPYRERKLLLHKRQIHKIVGAVTRKGMTAVPLKIYANAKGKIKIEFALALGMKKHDKRQSIRDKEWQRQKHRTLKVQRNP